MEDMLNEHDMTKKMLNIIRESLIKEDNGQMSSSVEPETQENNANPVFSDVILTLDIEGIQYTIRYDGNNSIDLSTPNGEPVQIDDETVKIQSQLKNFRNIWIEKWSNRKNEVKNESGDELVLKPTNGITDNSYPYFNEDLQILKKINPKVEIVNYVVKF